MKSLRPNRSNGKDDVGFHARRERRRKGTFSLAAVSDSPHRLLMTKPHYSERIRDYSDEELRNELLRNEPSSGASQIVRNEIARRHQARSIRNTHIFIGLGIVTILVSVVGLVIGL